MGRMALLAVLGLFVVGTVFYRIVEGWSWIDSFYFTVVTLTTVGYGDLAPTKVISKIFTVVLILGGVGAILAFLDALVRRTAERRIKESETESD
jgi:voltage-gated potassium channel